MKRRKLLGSVEAAKILGFTPDYVRRLCAAGTIKAEKISNDWIMYEAALKSIKRQRFPKEAKEQVNDSGQ